MTDIETSVTAEEREALRRRISRQAAKRKNADAREAFVAAKAGFVDAEALRKSMNLLMEQRGLWPAESAADTARGEPRAAPLAFPSSNVDRWTPIGPSTVRRGQAEGRPRVSGRVRDLAVSPDGRRVYAATAKGGVWYSGDGGATWAPLGGWASEPRRVGGNISEFASGCLLVDFGADAADDFVMVGTGETGAFQGSANAAPMRGMGVLVATAPGVQTIEADPWEAATGIEALEGVTIARMARVPGSHAGQNGDRVIAATSGGLYLGTRTISSGVGGFDWVPLAAPPPPPAPSGRRAAGDPTDLLYVGNRLFVCFRGSGVAVSDDNGASFSWVSMTLNSGLPGASVLVGRMSLASNEDANTVYVLGEVDTTPGSDGGLVAHVWRIANPSAAAPAAMPLSGVPASDHLWPGQRDYDQAIMVITHDGEGGSRRDRLYIGGSLIRVRNWNASIWAFDVTGTALVPAAAIADQPAGVHHGADRPGLIGNAIHPDVHALRKATNADGVTRQVWVACDGGVFVSLHDGQTNTFASRNVGLASIEAGFVASHPTSSHFAMLGCQDNGRQVRVGDTVWEVKTTMQGDGGGVLFHPLQSHYVMGQYSQGVWACDPSAHYVPPLVTTTNDPENEAAAFYSGISSIVKPAGNRARIALGTNRVWLTDNLGSANLNTWRVLPITAAGALAPARDPRPGNRRPGTHADMHFGVPALGAVITVKWANPTTLLALYTGGVVRYTENAASPGNWRSETLLSSTTTAPDSTFVTPAATFFTDIAPVPGSNDFYLCGTGQTTQWRPGARPDAAADSCFYYDATAGGFRTTGLGDALPAPAGDASSPIDPAYSVVVDPADSNTVYVGTVTGVWRATKDPATNTHGDWTPLVNGLPESPVQDLTVWTDPAGGADAPRLLRAALQSRGVWEVDLARQELVRTYLRVHERDDRRRFPTPLKNPRRRPTAPDVFPMRSPDITIRPAAPVTNTPSFPGVDLVNGRFRYQLWTFQTAFRWLYPSIIPDGRWTDQFGDLVERHRISLGMSGHRKIDAALWNTVMTAANDEAGNPGVYRASWQNALAPNLPGSEIDLMETVLPRRDRGNIWMVYHERSTVDVLLHHRDTRPVPADEAFAMLLWRADRGGARLAATDCSSIPDYARSLLTGSPGSAPDGWNVALAADGTPLHRLPVALAARMPRAVSIDVDLSAVPTGHRVMLLALAGSTADPFAAPTAGAIDRVDRFVRRWPHAAARLISCWRRPGAQIHG